MATSLYHPDTVDRSFAHLGDGAEPGLKDEAGKWDVSPHGARIIAVDDDVLATWHAVLEGESVPVRQTRMVYAVNRATAAVLAKLAAAPRLGSLGLEFSSGWHEKNDRTKGFFESDWGTPDSWRDVILQGPHLFVSTPLYKTPNESMLHNQDWSETDFETLAPDTIPVTSYKPTGDPARYNASYTRWSDGSSARDHYRIAWRYMAANTGSRTLSPALLPPGSAHIHGIGSAGGSRVSLGDLAESVGVMASLLSDFAMRIAPKATLSATSIGRLARVTDSRLTSSLRLRALRLNCVTAAYGDLWQDAWLPGFVSETWALQPHFWTPAPLSSTDREWTRDTPLRRASDRRQAQVEIDAIVALSLGITADELCTIYRTQFPVLFGYDRREYLYDANGRLVPIPVQQVWRKKGDAITEGERTYTNASGTTYVYELPFVNLDREADMRNAYVHFERVLQERS